jgi:hypothetical protein
LFLCVALQQTGTLFAADAFVKDLLSKLPTAAVCVDAGGLLEPGSFQPRPFHGLRQNPEKAF